MGEKDITLDSLLISSNKPSLVVVIHGYIGKPVAFVPLAQELAKEHDVLLYALRGHKFSDSKDRLRTKMLEQHKGSKGIFSLTQAIEDQVNIARRFAGNYASIGYFGFSVGATIAVYASHDAIIQNKLKGIYLASPYLSARDLRYWGWLLDIVGTKGGKGPFSLGEPALRDAKIGIDIVRVAIAENDDVTKSNEQIDIFKARYGQNNVVVVEGNHCFNPRTWLYLGKDSLDAPENTALFSDIREFFAHYLR